MRMVSIKKAAESIGVSIDTLRRWESEGKIKSKRTPGGHRRYDLDKLRGLIPRKYTALEEKLTAVYARVSSNDQKKDLERQISLLETFCSANGWEYKIIQDLGSGLNYKKRGLKELIRSICNSEISRLVLTHKDRLLRFGSELVFSLCEIFGVEVVIINHSEETTFEEDLTKDVLEIITVFSARLYGSRSHKNKKIVQRLQEAANEVCK